MRGRLVALALGAALLAACMPTRHPVNGTVPLEWMKIAQARAVPHGTDTSRVTLRYPSFVDGPPPAGLDSLNAWVRGVVFRRWDGGVARDSGAFLAAFVAEQSPGGLHAQPGERAWTLARTVKVVCDTMGVVTLSLDEFASTGGARPSGALTYTCFERRSGRRLRFADLYRAGAIDSMSAAAEPAFRAAASLHEGDDLGQAGFTFPGGRFRLNDNVAVTGEGLRFRFNLYEIAPYAMGAFDVLVPYATLAPWARADGPLASSGRTALP